MFPTTTAATTGAVLALQMTLAFTVSGARGKHKTWIGDGGHEALNRLARRHANLAENAGIFMVGFLLLELSTWKPAVLRALCVAFVGARLLHAAGLSRPNTNNFFRLAGALGTYLIGFVLAAILIWRGVAVS